MTFACYSHYAASVDEQKKSSLIVLAAAIIACIRLKGQDVKPSPKLSGVVYESVNLARMIVDAVERRI